MVGLEVCLYCQAVSGSQDAVFPYHRIVNDLRLAIASEHLAAGERLPSEWELAERYGTSRPTVRRAIAVLKAEGLVLTEQGRGAFVRPKPHMRLLVSGAAFRRHRRQGVAGFNAQVVEQGQAPEQRLLAVGRVPAAPHVAIRLDVDEDAEVVVRRRLFLIEGEPVALCDSYYRADMVAGTAIEEPRRIRGGAMAVVEDPKGPIRRRAVRSVDDVIARMPSPNEVGDLHLAPGVPVIRVLRTIYDGKGQPLEVQESIAAADRHELRYEVAMR